MNEEQLKKQFAKLKKRLMRDWRFDESGKLPENPSKFDSMYTNIFGERWWCRREVDADGMPQILVWGDDVDIALSRRGSRTELFPWIMEEGEQLWLRANMFNLRCDEESLALRRERQDSTSATTKLRDMQ